MPTLEDLERLAANASPGPWKWGEPGVEKDGIPESILASNTQYIAACSPQTILALVRVAKAAKEYTAVHDADECVANAPPTKCDCMLCEALAALEQTP
jgi:hypothetical protein